MKVLVMGTETELWALIKVYVDDGREEISDQTMPVFFGFEEARAYRQKLYKQMRDEGIEWIIDDGDELIPDWDTDDVEYYYVIKKGKIQGDQNVEETH